MARSLDKCPICNLSAEVEILVNDYNQHYYFCVICGRFAINDNLLYKIGHYHAASPLKLYHIHVQIGNQNTSEKN